MACRRILAGLLGLVWVAFVPATLHGEKEKSSPEALKEFKVAYRYYRAGKLEEAIARIETFLEKYAKDPLAKQAREILLDSGVGEEVRVSLTDRDIFRKKFKLPEKDILEMSETALEDLRPHYARLKEFFGDYALKIVFYDSQARYRKATGNVQRTSGNFSVETEDFKKKSLRGEIEWFFPRKTGSLKDHKLMMKGTLYHECTHYLNRIYLGGLLPPVFEEGMAKYFETRLVTEFFQTRRETGRERTQGEARNGLNTIKKYEGFVKMLDSPRGFGQGDLMINRWYAFCYSVVDFIQEGELNGRKASFETLLDKLDKLCRPKLEKAASSAGATKPQRFEGKALLEELVKEFYDVDLKTFHKALVQHILENYKQR